MSGASLGAALLVAVVPHVLVLALLARSAQSIILILGGAFFFLLASLCTSVTWYFVPGWLRSEEYFLIPVAVCFQELFRLALYGLFKLAQKPLENITKTQTSLGLKLRLACATGFGFGAMLALTSYVPFLASALGPGFIPCASCPSLSLTIISGVLTTLVAFQHPAWTLFAFDALESSSTAPLLCTMRVLLVVALHGAAAAATIPVRRPIKNGCWYAIGAESFLLIISYTFVYFIVWRRIVRRKRSEDNTGSTDSSQQTPTSPDHAHAD